VWQLMVSVCVTCACSSYICFQRCWHCREGDLRALLLLCQGPGWEVLMGVHLPRHHLAVQRWPKAPQSAYVEVRRQLIGQRCLVLLARSKDAV
jgi:hypothetical protein